MCAHVADSVDGQNGCNRRGACELSGTPECGDPSEPTDQWVPALGTQPCHFAKGDFLQMPGPAAPRSLFSRSCSSLSISSSFGPERRYHRIRGSASRLPDSARATGLLAPKVLKEALDDEVRGSEGRPYD